MLKNCDNQSTLGQFR